MNAIVGQLSALPVSYDKSDLRYRMPLVIAIISVFFQAYPQWIEAAGKVFFYGSWIHVFGLGILVSAAMVATAKYARTGLALFTLIAAVAILPGWTAIANHMYLALWAIIPALLFREWWRSDDYAFYLRMTIVIVMFAAFFQKILAGSYIDGSFIQWMNTTSSWPTRRMFSGLCSLIQIENCNHYVFVSNFILVWQLAVGILLLWGIKSILFLIIEIGFLLGAGIYADEMNFQVLNIAILCIVFRFGMPFWLLFVCLIFLAIDIPGLNGLLLSMLNHVQ